MDDYAVQILSGDATKKTVSKRSMMEKGELASMTSRDTM